MDTNWKDRYKINKFLKNWDRIGKKTLNINIENNIDRSKYERLHTQGIKMKYFRHANEKWIKKIGL